MAEAVVGVLIGKLGEALANEAATFGASLLCKEASTLKGLFGEIREAKEELEGMQAFLNGADRFKDTDETTGIFVKKIRGLAFEIEDVVDEFTYKLEDKHGGFASKMKKRIKHVKTWRRLAHKLQDIKLRLQGVDRRKVRYDMSGIEKEGESSGRSRSADHSVYFAREEDLVCIEKNKHMLMHWLTGDFEQGIKIATIWGMGGVGKTTLVSQMFKTAKMVFDISAWVAVSPSYQAEDLLEKIARGFGISIDVANSEKRSLVEIIHNYLQEYYSFGRKRLIRHWIAAGFIKETGSKTVEEVAEGYLNELVNRSLLQVAKRNLFGRVKKCRMHDIIRFLALAKSNEECFCQVYNGSGTFSTENTRRLSIQSTSIEQLSAPGLRSLYFFRGDLRTDSLEAFLKSFKLLSTLDLQGVLIKRLPKVVFNLFNLRFLGLRETHIEYLPKEIGRLQNLEVLDAYNAKLLALPVEVVTLRKLKYLYVATIPEGADDRVMTFHGIRVPDGIRN